METAVIIYRDLNGTKIRQNHKTGFYNANDLINLYNISVDGTDKKQKRIIDYLGNASSLEWQDKIMAEESHNSNVDKSTQLENGLVIAKKGRVNGGTWMHPYVFIDFALWLNVDFKYTCIKWLHDNLIQTRDECGEGFKKINQSIFDTQSSYDPFAYSNEAKMINKIVFGTSEAGQRNVATKEQLDILDKIQKADENLIREGMPFRERGPALARIKKLIA